MKRDGVVVEKNFLCGRRCRAGLEVEVKESK